MSDTLTITRAEYDRLLERIEDLEDAAGLRALEERIAADGVPADALPVEAFERILAGESRLRVWREHRGLTLAALAVAASLPTSYLSEIETGRKPGSIKAWRALAAALGVSMDELVA